MQIDEINTEGSGRKWKEGAYRGNKRERERG
jgi:hypothetical protein